MVEIIGLTTISALVWLLAWSMAGESDAERKRSLNLRDQSISGLGGEGQKEKSFKVAA
ncbi:hypothetical protein ACO9S2_13120 [Nitrospira sp. NS4]|uniref:hypothetical protein n=1 Tax=Nitrospira sp. NS4 TaxID=3414498 RepID=UPI002CED7908|nr:hypothetical protein [Nitrospira sp.]